MWQSTLVSEYERKHGPEIVFVEALRTLWGKKQPTSRTAFLYAVAEGAVEPPKNEDEIERAEKRLQARFRKPQTLKIRRAMERLFKEPLFVQSLAAGAGPKK
jgi:hypothetical protein